MNANTELGTPDQPSAETLEAAVANHPFLAGLAREHLRVLLRNVMRVRFGQGETIFREGDPANRFYLIETGKVSLETREKNRPDLHVQTIGAGDVLGWSWLFPPFAWHFQARATRPTHVICCDGGHLLVQAEENSEFGYDVMRRITQILIQRLQAARKKLIQSDSQVSRTGAFCVP